MRTVNVKPSLPENDFCRKLEEYLQRVFDLRCAARAAHWDRPQSLKQVLDTWTRVHQQHQMQRQLLKNTLYERQFRIKSARTEKAPRDP